MERTVLKKRMKGLAALLLAAVMMFGSSLSVLAASYTLTLDYSGGYVWRDCSLTEGTIITSEDDIHNTISIYYGLCCKIDEGEMSECMDGNSGDTIRFSNFLDEGKSYKVTAIDKSDEGILKITLQTLNASGAGNGNAGGAGSSSGSDSKKSEKTHEEIFSKKLIKGVAHAKAGDNMAIDASEWHSFRAGLLNELLAKEGVSYTFYYKYRDECFSVTVPAGTVFDESIPWYGPYKMSAMFGRTMIDESTLNAAIKK